MLLQCKAVDHEFIDGMMIFDPPECWCNAGVSSLASKPAGRKSSSAGQATVLVEEVPPEDKSGQTGKDRHQEIMRVAADGKQRATQKVAMRSAATAHAARECPSFATLQPPKWQMTARLQELAAAMDPQGESEHLLKQALLSIQPDMR